MKKIKTATLNWLLSRRSADDTSNRGMWIVIGLVLILGISVIIIAGSETGFTNGMNIFTGATDGTTTKAPGDWGK